MLFFFALILLFVAVFGFIAWRIMARQAATAARPDTAYVCPKCNETHCDCRKKEDPDR